MTTSPKLGMSYIVSNQAQKEITHNDALNDLDFLAQAGVLDRDLATPPAVPATGDAYLVGTAPTGAWAGHAGKIAAYYGGWKIKTPREGWNVWLCDEDRLLSYNGSAWGNLATPFLEASWTWDPASLADGAGVTSGAVAVAGVAFGDFVLVAAPYSLQGVLCVGYVSAVGNVAVRLQNETGATVDLSSGLWRVRVIKN